MTNFEFVGLHEDHHLWDKLQTKAFCGFLTTFLNLMHIPDAFMIDYTKIFLHL